MMAENELEEVERRAETQGTGGQTKKMLKINKRGAQSEVEGMIMLIF